MYKEYDYNRDDFNAITEKEKLMKKIEVSRENLYTLIEIEGNVNSKNIIIESQKLDDLLTKYEKLKKVLKRC